MEVIGYYVLTDGVVRFVKLLDLPERVFTGLKFWLPPGEAKLQLLKAPRDKRPKQQPREKTVEEKIELLDLQRGLITPGLMSRRPGWALYETLVLALVRAAFVTFWQEAYCAMLRGAPFMQLGTVMVLWALALTFFVLFSTLLRQDSATRFWALFGAAVGLVVGVVGLASPEGTMTFDIGAAQAHASSGCGELMELIGVPKLEGACKMIDGGLLSVLLAIISALLGAVLAAPAQQASYFFQQPKLRHEPPLTRLFLVLDPLLNLILISTYLRPLALRPLQRLTCTEPSMLSSPTHAQCTPKLPLWAAAVVRGRGWSAVQVALHVLVVLVRVAVVRWELMTYLQVGPLQQLFAELSRKKEPSAADIEPLFTSRFDNLIHVAIKLLGPSIWLLQLCLLMSSKALFPPLTAWYLRASSPSSSQHTPLDPQHAIDRTPLNGTIVDTLGVAVAVAERNWRGVYDMVLRVWMFPVLSEEFFRNVVGFLLFTTTVVYMVLYAATIGYRVLQMQSFVVGKQKTR